ncbi:cdc42 effector protein 5 [Boleophthalmus pectinirostris]|uniref:cdc42 effector protein 5 n=1 Tax=Boleophthalmus pectinirostris TaxID=150288 RepID=UPI000A1C3D60|nr:cdc42 effector protein 5 [Boleophthalmus pectinirostris]
MPLHKSSRAPRLDPTMISAPLGDFRHTMHIGRGGDTFGDTSFLSTIGPNPRASETSSSEISSPPPTIEPAVQVDHVDTNETLHSESVSSFTLDLDLDLGPSMLGDVLGVMDSLGLDEDVFSPTSSVSPVEINQPNGAMETSVDLRNELNGKSLDENGVEGDSRIPDGNSFRAKALRPKVRFSDKREEIIRQASEEEEGQGFDFQDQDEMVCLSPTKGDSEMERGVIMGTTEVELPPSPASSHSSEYEGVTALDRRKVDICHSETDSEEEEEVGKGYTFEDEFDDEIGL